jgi:hypothetical protein
MARKPKGCVGLSILCGAEQSLAGDGVQRALRSRFPPRLKRGVRFLKREWGRPAKASRAGEEYNVADNKSMIQITCFVIGPIGDKHAEHKTESRQIYEESITIWENVIEPACYACDLHPIRADQISRAGEIPDQICHHLRDDTIVIADVTGGNSNVMYELGLRHTTGKLTIQLGERGKLPFDVAAIRTIMFRRSEAGLIEARKELEKAIRVGLETGADPVTATRVWLGLSAQAPATAEQSRGSTELEEELGYLDKLADAETAIAELSGTLQELTTSTTAVNDLLVSSTEQVRRSDASGSGFGGRLAIAHRLAKQLEGPADIMEPRITEYEQRMKKMAPGVDYLLQRLEEEPNGAEEHAFVENFLLFANAVHNAMEESEGFSGSMSGIGEASRELRRATGRISRILKRFKNASSPATTWRDRLLAIQQTQET